MNLAVSYTRSIVGIAAKSVSVEVHLSNGLPNFTIVGLPEATVKESKDRVRSALINSQFDFPCRRITVNLAPANLPKSGSGFDLPIALGILAASGQIPSDKLKNCEFIAELGLSGELRPVSGIIPIILAAYRDKTSLIIAEANANEATLINYDHVFSAKNLRQVCQYLIEGQGIDTLPAVIAENSPSLLDWTDVKGQFHAKRALEIAACGGHSVLMSGSPGSGKTMLAKRFVSLLPDLTEADALEAASIHSVRNHHLDYTQWRRPAFRAPHHTASAVALVGGGNPPKPGEISLAHNGVLFLDELTQFNRCVLETLREPLEAGSVSIARAGIHTQFPARFQLLAAMNPCPCGNWGNVQISCRCSPDKVQRYLAKISGPILDRIDIHLVLQPLSTQELLTASTSTVSSASIKQHVVQLRKLQLERQGCINAQLNSKDCEKHCYLTSKEYDFLQQFLPRFKLSARAYHRLLKIARTIADMANQSEVTVSALQQAFSFRQNVNSAA